MKILLSLSIGIAVLTSCKARRAGNNSTGQSIKIESGTPENSFLLLEYSEWGKTFDYSEWGKISAWQCLPERIASPEVYAKMTNADRVKECKKEGRSDVRTVGEYKAAYTMLAKILLPQDARSEKDRENTWNRFIADLKANVLLAAPEEVFARSYGSEYGDVLFTVLFTFSTERDRQTRNKAVAAHLCQKVLVVANSAVGHYLDFTCRSEKFPRRKCKIMWIERQGSVSVEAIESAPFAEGITQGSSLWVDSQNIVTANEASQGRLDTVVTELFWQTCGNPKPAWTDHYLIFDSNAFQGKRIALEKQYNVEGCHEPRYKMDASGRATEVDLVCKQRLTYCVLEGLRDDAGVLRWTAGTQDAQHWGNRDSVPSWPVSGPATLPPDQVGKALEALVQGASNEACKEKGWQPKF